MTDATGRVTRRNRTDSSPHPTSLTPTDASVNGVTCPVCATMLPRRQVLFCANRHGHCPACVSKMVTTCPTGACRVYRWRCSICRTDVEELVERERNPIVLRGVVTSLLDRVRELSEDDDVRLEME